MLLITSGSKISAHLLKRSVSRSAGAPADQAISSYKHPEIQGLESMLNVQERSGKAKPAQVRELIKIIEKFELLRDEDVSV